MSIIKLKVPATQQELDNIKTGDIVHLSGTIITGRDAAHKRIVESLNNNIPLPFTLENQTIYYTGPCPASPDKIIGACGPTTSSRMDSYTPPLLDLGLKIMIGKGQRSPEVIESIKKNKAIYFAATGGAGALISQCVTSCKILAFEDLGPEAVYELTVSEFPLIAAIDTRGNDLYKSGPGAYCLRSHKP